MKGNANLCRAIVRAGARLGINNNQGINIFNYQVATKQLLFRLLGTFSHFIIHQAFIIKWQLHKWLCADTMWPPCWSCWFITRYSFCLCLDMLSKEPPWCDGSNCYECAAKFGVTTRKHHWLVVCLLKLYVSKWCMINPFSPPWLLTLAATVGACCATSAL